MSGRRLKVLLTGPSGFIGRGLVPELVGAGHTVRAALRSFAPLPDGVEGAVIGDLRRPVNLAQALRDIDVVIHSAGLAHAEPGLPEADYRDINAATTLALAQAAHQAGARRFILMSSVRAQVGPSADDAVTEERPPAPTDAYGRSKLEAERLLADAAIASVVLRPVVVHGPGMRFNMAALYDFARRGGPLPFGALAARRSILAREHLADAVVLALDSEAMAGGTFLVADPEPLTVGEMIAALRAGLGRRAGLIPVPRGIVRLAARATGRAAEFDRIDSNLVVDPSRLVAAGWRPRRPSREALAMTARAIAAEAGAR